MKKKSKSAILKQQIIKHLYFNQDLSCGDMAADLDKSVPSIAKVLEELLAEGLIIGQGHAPSSGGRRPMVYSLKPDALYLLAVSMDQLSTRMNLVDLNGTSVTGIGLKELQLHDNPGALTDLIKYIKAYLHTSGIAPTKIAGIGIGMPGFINTKAGINHTYLATGGTSLTEYLTTQTGIKTYIDNDSSLIALAEQRFGQAREKKDVMVVNLGWGIGLGMILDGTLYRGHTGFAGEFSHIPLYEEGELCSCGKKGCLEAEASLLVVTKKAIAGIHAGGISSLIHIGNSSYEKAGDEVMNAALQGDQYAIELYSDAGYKIGKALSTLIHIMNPGTIILSGRGARIARILMAPIQQAINKYCIPRLVEGTELLISDLGPDAELTGAALLVMENFELSAN